jgi:predicted phosphodiesterase
VWIDLLPQFLDSEKERIQNYLGNDAFFSLIRPGILFLLDDRTKERERIHAEFVQFWEKLGHAEFFALLTEKIRRESVSSHCSSNEASETKQTQDTSPKKYHEKDLKKSTEQPDSVSTASMHHDDTVVALIGDVHANLPALNAVLADVKKRGVTMILNAGDLVGYGPYPEEVVEALRSNEVISTMGNYERSLMTQWWLSEEKQSLADDQDWDADPEDTFMLRLKREVSKWTYDILSSGSREYVAGLPECVRMTLFGRNLLIVHGSPSSMTEYITSETPKARLSEIATSSNAGVIISGHAHMPCVREVDGVLFINTGSVGRSEDGDPRACYALLSCGDENNLVVEHIRVSYDVDETVRKMEQYELPERYIRAIREGRSPDLLPDTDETTKHTRQDE